MSYIRSASNPEGLYVLCEQPGYVKFYWWKDEEETRTGSLPFPHFAEVCRQWEQQTCSGKSAHSGGFSAKMKDCKVHLRWKDDKGKWELYLWEVTWEHVVRSCNREMEEGENAESEVSE
ncbi:MAG: hypothetical protein ABIH23_28530 [bacterium]